MPEDYQKQVLICGMFGTTVTPVSTDEHGALKIVDLYQNSIMPDATEAQSWDSPIGSLISNMNRIRNQIVTITGETWGTVSHSIATVWAKFHDGTGHAHSGAADDGKPVDHGTCTGLTDDDHERYFDKDGSKGITGGGIFRSVNNDALRIRGGGAGSGEGSRFSLVGSDHATAPGSFSLLVPNAAKTGEIQVLNVSGATDTPVVNWRALKLTNVADPVSAQDAATKAWVESVAIAVTGMVMLWSGSIATIPTGWLLCNGANNTPDHRNRFIVGAGDIYAVGATGGAATHALTIAELAAHTHGDSGSSVAYTAAQAYRSSGSGTETTTSSTGSGTAHNTLPPYYAEAYIMKT